MYLCWPTCAGVQPVHNAADPFRPAPRSGATRYCCSGLLRDPLTGVIDSYSADPYEVMMFYATLIVTAMALFASVAAAAFAWSVAGGQFRNLDEAARSIFWDDDADDEVPLG